MVHKEFQYQLRFALLPSPEEDQRIEELVSFCQKGAIDDVIFFIGAEEANDGHLTKEEAAPYVALIKKAKAALAPLGITTSINPWFTLGHGDRGRQLKKDQHFQTLVDPNGCAASVMVCPLDEEWRSYYVDYLDYLIEEIHPERVWLEDDFRLHNHEPLSDGGCFCEKHMALYQAYLHEDVSREEMVAKMLSNGEEAAKYRRAYQAVNEQVMKETAKAIASRLHHQDVSVSLMTGDPRYESLEGRDLRGILTSLKTQKTPYHRIHLPGYREMAPQNFIRDFGSNSLREAFLSGSAFPVVPEVENVPHSVLSKSATYSLFQTTAGLMLGSVGVAFSIFDFLGNGVLCPETYEKLLREKKPFFSEVASLSLTPESMKGVQLLVQRDTCVYRDLSQHTCLNEIIPDDSEFSSFFMGMGIPFAYTENKAIESSFVAVGGDTLRSLSKEEIRALFAKNHVLLDGRSVEILQEKGLLGLLGAFSARRIPERNGEVACEKGDPSFLVQGKKGYLSPEQYFVGDFISLTYDKKADVHPYTEALDFHFSHPKAALTEACGHFVLPYKVKQSEITDTAAPEAEVGLISPQKKAFVEEYLLQKSPRFVFAEDLGVAASLYEKGGTSYLFLLNATLDPIENVRLRTPSFLPKRVLLENGSWKEVSPSFVDGVVLVGVALAALSAILVEGEWKNE
jgi:hypothetical protein